MQFAKLDTATRLTARAASGVEGVAAVVVAVLAPDGATGGGVIVGEVERLPEGVADVAADLAAAHAQTGKPGTVTTGIADVAGKKAKKGKGTQVRVFAVGIGRHTDAAAVHAFAATAARAVRTYGVGKVALLPPGDTLACAAAAGYTLGSFRNTAHKGAALPPTPEGEGEVTLHVLTDDADAVERGHLLALAQNYARTVAFRPGNVINPATLADEAKRMAKTLGLSVRVIDADEAQELGMGGLLGVGRGSETPPCLIALGHRVDVKKKAGKKAASPDVRPLLAVGKAVTFDTGGISIKPALGMGSMVFDKCGGMAVLGFLAACAVLGVDRPVVGLIPAAENMPSGTAYRPGDVLTLHNGVTVEVTNTDAEGRLILADALSWGIATYNPLACVDLATLTGAAVVALGTTRAAAFCNDDALFDALDHASARAGEKLWRMPLGDDYREPLESNVADLVNAPGRWGGAATAAEFLHHFIPGNVAGTEEIPWCHLDIAPVADTEKDAMPYVKGATGFGVRTLVEWAETYTTDADAEEV